MKYSKIIFGTLFFYWKLIFFLNLSSKVNKNDGEVKIWWSDLVSKLWPNEVYYFEICMY